MGYSSSRLEFHFRFYMLRTYVCIIDYDNLQFFYSRVRRGHIHTRTRRIPLPSTCTSASLCYGYLSLLLTTSTVRSTVSFPCALVRSRLLLFIPRRFSAFPRVLYVSEFASVGHYLPITCNPVHWLWPLINICCRFANNLHSQ